LKETIADYEENGAGAEMPEEFRALQESFAEVESVIQNAHKVILRDMFQEIEELGAGAERHDPGCPFL